MFIYLLSAVVSLFAITGLFSCSTIKKETVEVREISKKDIEGQWSLVRIDTVPSKQSLKVNEVYNNTGVEYERSVCV